MDGVLKSIEKHKLNLNPLDLASLAFTSTLLIDFPVQSASYRLRSLQYIFFFSLAAEQFYFEDGLPGIKLHSQQFSLDTENYHEDVLNFIAAFHKWMLLIHENPLQPAK